MEFDRHVPTKLQPFTQQQQMKEAKVCSGFYCIGDNQSKRKEKDKKKDGEVWGVVMGSIGSNDLEGKENLIEFRREEKKGQ